MSKKPRKPGTSSKNTGRLDRRTLLAALGLGLAAPLARALPGPDCPDGYPDWPETNEKYWTVERKKAFQEYWKKIGVRIEKRESLDRKLRAISNPTISQLEERERLDLEIQVLRNSVTMDKCASPLALRNCYPGTPIPK